MSWTHTTIVCVSITGDAIPVMVGFHRTPVYCFKQNAVPRCCALL